MFGVCTCDHVEDEHEWKRGTWAQCMVESCDCDLFDFDHDLSEEEQ